MSEIEEWRSVPDYPYEISSFGRVRRTGKAQGARVGRILTNRIVAGYPAITLYSGTGVESEKFRYIHDLVCETFHGPKPTLSHEVAHWDGTRTNCRIDNLRWATRKENMQDAIRHDTVKKGSIHYNAKLNEEAVRQIRDAAAHGVSYPQLSRKFGIGPSAIGKVVTRRTWSHVQ